MRGLKIVIVLAILIVIALVVYMIVHKKGGQSGNGNKKVSITLQEPGKTKNAIVYISNDKLDGITVEVFFQTIFELANDLPWKFSYVYWDTVSINGNSITTVNGSIPAEIGTQILYTWLNSKPDEFNVVTKMHHACIKSECDAIAPSCDPCKGEIPKCTETGCECVPGLQCPTGDVLEKCCQQPGSPGPIGHCEIKDGHFSLTCSPCPPKDCGKPGCDCVGYVCTSTGPVCRKGVTCPTGDDLQACAPPGKYATCSNGVISFHDCSGWAPGEEDKCKDYNCDLRGPVCDSDGKLYCKPGVRCPPKNVLPDLNCCATSKNGPYAACSQDTPSSASLSCTNCGIVGGKPPSDLDCPPRCNGQGPTCTSKGAICSPNLMCSGGLYTPEIIASLKCCDAYPHTSAVCKSDAHGACVKCACTDGREMCGPEPLCSATGVPHPPQCCPAGSGCSQNSVTHEWECCPATQNCYVDGKFTCCPAGTQCAENECQSICGPTTCKTGEECMVIEGATDATKARLEAEGGVVDPRTGYVYICKPQSDCEFGNELAIPPATANYYPCWAFPQHADKAGFGYCSYSTDKANLSVCFNNDNETSCNTDSHGCEWIDALSYAAANGADRINEDMQNLNPTDPDGFYCQGNAGTAYQRIVSFPGDKTACSWKDCWSHIAQPGIIDVFYDATNGNCVALQSCNEPTSGLQNNICTNDDTGKPTCKPNPGITPPITASSTFGTDCKTDPCPVQGNTGYTCSSDDGSIQEITYDCVYDATQPSKHACLMVKGGKGRWKNSTCEGKCDCPIGDDNKACSGSHGSCQWDSTNNQAHCSCVGPQFSDPACKYDGVPVSPSNCSYGNCGSCSCPPGFAVAFQNPEGTCPGEILCNSVGNGVCCKVTPT
uniref:Uncharacterized protein n=1 Tax=viral metagenome TaxID=1070528 RepID=A0A6C0EM19_9ZZZZ